jgi:hypothetical protein
MILSEMRSRTDRLQRGLTAFVRQPVDFCDMLSSRLRNLRQRPVKPYLCDPWWEAELHTQLGQPQPCAAAQGFWPLWERVRAEMTSRGVKTGPMSFSGWNDGDPGLTRAIWCLIHHLAASQVVETGVAHGITSRFVLEALQRNGAMAAGVCGVSTSRRCCSRNSTRKSALPCRTRFAPIGH